MLRSLASLFALSLVTVALAAGPVTWTFTSTVAADGHLMVRLQAQCEAGWHIYALTLPRDDGPLPTVLRVNESTAFKMGGPVQETPPEEVEDPNFGMKVRYHGGAPVFDVLIDRLTPEAFEVTGEVEFMCCNDRTCLPPQTVKFSVPIAAQK